MAKNAKPNKVISGISAALDKLAAPTPASKPGVLYKGNILGERTESKSGPIWNRK